MPDAYQFGLHLRSVIIQGEVGNPPKRTDLHFIVCLETCWDLLKCEETVWC